jgi:hypothetical protein
MNRTTREFLVSITPTHRDQDVGDRILASDTSVVATASHVEVQGGSAEIPLGWRATLIAGPCE